MISTPGNLTNGKTASLTLRDNDRSVYASLSPTRLVNTSRLWLTGHVDFFGKADLFEGLAEHAAACVAGERHTDGLGNERHGARCTRSDTFFLGVPAHICAVGLYFMGCPVHSVPAQPHKTAPQRRPKGSLSLTRMRGSFFLFCMVVL